MVKYQRLTLLERVRIEKFIKLGLSKSEIAERIGRNKSTISREINRWGPKSDYNCALADFWAIEERTQYKNIKLRNNSKLRKIVIDLLKKRWSPEQVSNELRKLYPNNFQMNISYESIYTYIYILAKGELRKELISYLRQGKSKRYQKKVIKTDPESLMVFVSINETPLWKTELLLGIGKATLLSGKIKKVLSVQSWKEQVVLFLLSL